LNDEVFISFSSADQRACDAVYRRLAGGRDRGGAGARVWRCTEGVRSSEHFDDLIVERLDEVRCFVLLLSRNALKSGYVKNETKLAFDRFNEGKITSFLVFRLDDVRVEGTGVELHLARVQKVNETVTSLDEDLDKLVKDVCEALEVPEPEPETWWQRLARRVRVSTRRAYRKATAPGLPRLATALSGLAALTAITWGIIHRPPPPAPTTAGVIEISTSGVRSFGVELVPGGDGKFELADEEAAAAKAAGAAKIALDDRLAYREGRRFEPATVAAVADSVRMLIADLERRGTSRRRIWVVISSGVRQLVAPKARSTEVPDWCLADLKKQVRERVGLEGDRIAEVTPVEEVRLLLLEVYRRNRSPSVRKSLKKQVEELGDGVVIDVGSVNIRAAYWKPVLGPDDLPHATGISLGIPGTKTFEKSATGTDPPSTDTAGGREELDRRFRAAAEGIVSELREAFADTSMFGESSRVYLAGGAAWAMCRIVRDDADLTARYVLLKPQDERDPAKGLPARSDFLLFREWLIAQGDEVYNFPPRMVDPASDNARFIRLRLDPTLRDPERARQYQKHLLTIKKTFNQPQLLAAAELLIAIDQALLRHGREVYFINDGAIDWIASYLVEKVNSDAGSSVADRGG
jgi:hypothetical protein